MIIHLWKNNLFVVSRMNDFFSQFKRWRNIFYRISFKNELNFVKYLEENDSIKNVLRFIFYKTSNALLENEFMHKHITISYNSFKLTVWHQRSLYEDVKQKHLWRKGRKTLIHCFNMSYNVTKQYVILVRLKLRHDLWSDVISCELPAFFSNK